MFSKACEYGIKAAIFIAVQSMQDRRASLKDIAAGINSPSAFTAKILQQLVQSGIIESVRGTTGGFQLARKDIDAITLSQIVSAIDGDAVFRGCGLGLKSCNEKFPCPVHDKFKKVRDDLREMLEHTSLYELATGLECGLTHLKREESIDEKRN